MDQALNKDIPYPRQVLQMSGSPDTINPLAPCPPQTVILIKDKGLDAYEEAKREVTRVVPPDCPKNRRKVERAFKGIDMVKNIEDRGHKIIHDSIDRYKRAHGSSVDELPPPVLSESARDRIEEKEYPDPIAFTSLPSQ
ncbi:unnamed protein product, partial [Mesorhabditis spiculigera]